MGMVNATAADASNTAPRFTATNLEARTSLRVKAAAWTSGITAVCTLAGIDDVNTWSAAFVVACVIAMVTFVCYQILYYR